MPDEKIMGKCECTNHNAKYETMIDYLQHTDTWQKRQIVADENEMPTNGCKTPSKVALRRRSDRKRKSK